MNKISQEAQAWEVEPMFVELAFFSVKYYSEISLNSNIIASKIAVSLVLLY